MRLNSAVDARSVSGRFPVCTPPLPCSLPGLLVVPPGVPLAAPRSVADWKRKRNASFPGSSRGFVSAFVSAFAASARGIVRILSNQTGYGIPKRIHIAP